MQTRTKILLGIAVAYLLFAKKGGAVSLGSGRFLAMGDPRWGSKTVGNGPGVYSGIGCVTTAVTIAVNMLKGTTLTPDQLKPGIMLAASDYDRDSIFSDQAFSKLGCVVRGRVRGLARTSSNIAMMKSLIDDCLAKGGVALVRVDYDVSTQNDNHTVVCFAHSALGYQCADPAGGVEVILDDNLFARRSASKTYSANGVQPVFRA